jgi:hypothetical protein
LQQLIEQRNDYLVCVKANQGRLHRWIEQQWQDHPPESVYQQQEQSHGRRLQWRVSVFKQLGGFATQWAGLQACICVERLLNDN